MAHSTSPNNGKAAGNRPARNIVVLGVGNTIHSDDGLGVHALRKMECDPRLPNGITVIDGGTRGIELLAFLYDCSQLLMLDAVDVGDHPGTMLRLAGDELQGLRTGTSVHQLGVADLLTTLPLVSEVDREIVILGVQPASTDWGTELSPPVKAAIDPLVDQAIDQVLLWIKETADANAPNLDCEVA
jgi:hydrogenase maturation protease